MATYYPDAGRKDFEKVFDFFDPMLRGIRLTLRSAFRGGREIDVSVTAAIGRDGRLIQYSVHESYVKHDSRFMIQKKRFGLFKYWVSFPGRDGYILIGGKWCDGTKFMDWKDLAYVYHYREEIESSLRVWADQYASQVPRSQLPEPSPLELYAPQ